MISFWFPTYYGPAKYRSKPIKTDGGWNSWLNQNLKLWFKSMFIYLYFFFGITCLHCIFQMYFNFFCGVPDILHSGLCTNSMDPFHYRLCDHALWWVSLTQDRHLLAILKLYMTMTFYCLWLPIFLIRKVNIGKKILILPSNPTSCALDINGLGWYQMEQVVNNSEGHISFCSSM